MSQYQYYEFQAIDRRLDDKDRAALRALSSRAKITATSFTNHYEWGDFRGDPNQLLDRYFDLHLYTSNWGVRRLAMRVPSRLVDLDAIDRIVGENESVTVRRSGPNLVIDIGREELDVENDWEEDDSYWIASLAPLREALLGGDLRIFYLLWLAEVADELVDDGVLEPLPGLGPLTDALDSFADFFCIDADLVEAAAERGAGAAAESLAPETISAVITALPDADRIDRLVRLAQGDAHVADELRADIRRHVAGSAGPSQPEAPLRKASDLLARAAIIRNERVQAEEARLAEEERRKQEAAAQERRARLDALLRRGNDVWREVESDIEQRNATSYDRAIDLLSALKTVAAENGTSRDFKGRIDAIRQTHARKSRFVERLAEL